MLVDIKDSAGLDALSDLLGERFTRNKTERERFGKDESFHPSCPPDAVVRPHRVEQVQQIVRICNQHRIAVIPYGMGTSLEGQVSALRGGVCIEFSDMAEIIDIQSQDMTAVVQPGVTRRQLNQALKGSGLFFSVDPGADATIGGMAATRASGTNTVRYGTIRENILSLSFVLADGRIIRTGKRARKSAAGYDLTHLMIGSEGTLGVITELTVKLHPVAEAVSAAVCSFECLDDAVNAVSQIIQYGIPVARIEVLDSMSIQAINDYSSTSFRRAPTLFLEFHGSQQSVREQAELVQEIISEHGGNDFDWTSNSDERNRMWRARHDAAWAIKAIRPDGEIWATDVCVPISRLAECISETQKDLAENDLLAPIVGHVGDGNFHLCLLIDHDNQDEYRSAQALHERMVKRALDMDGTCSGEHGIGYGKIDLMRVEHGDAVAVMILIKQALDPNGIMNPGKMFHIP